MSSDFLSGIWYGKCDQHGCDILSVLLGHWDVKAPAANSGASPTEWPEGWASCGWGGRHVSTFDDMEFSAIEVFVRLSDTKFSI